MEFTRKYWLEKVCLNVGVKYHPCGRNEFGLDCIGAGVVKPLNDCGVDTSHVDLKAYSPEGDGINLSYIFNNMFNQKSIDEIKEGDIILMKFFKHPQHIGVFLGNYYNNGKNYMLHASTLYDKVAIHDFNDWINRVVCVYSLKEFID